MEVVVPNLKKTRLFGETLFKQEVKMYSYSCPYCDWEIHDQPFLGTARLAFFRHLDKSEDCAIQFNKDNPLEV